MLRVSWKQGLSKPPSNAAQASRHDHARRKSRPGGLLMPRPRWALDEPPKAGWDNQDWGDNSSYRIRGIGRVEDLIL